MNLNLLANVVIDGVTYGMVLFVISVGLSVTLGLMRFVNLSHCAFAMIGGYCAATIGQKLGFNFWVSAASAVLLTGTVGAVLEVLVLRRIYRRKQLDQVLFTIGLTFVLIAGTNAFFGPQVQSIALPSSLSESVDLGFRTLPSQRVLVLVTGIAVSALVAFVVARTRFGIWLRAAVDNADTASTLGIPIRIVECVSFSAGAALAGLGGILGAELMPLEPYYALRYLVLVLVIVAVGGMGSITGSLVAAMLLGIVDTAAKYLASEWGNLYFFLIVLGLLTWRPKGLLNGQRT